MRGIDVAATWPSVGLLHYALFPIVLVVVLAASAVAGQKRFGLGFSSACPGVGISLVGCCPRICPGDVSGFHAL